MPSIDTQFLSIADAARILSVSRWTVGRMLADGEIPSVSARGVPRIDRADLDAWIAAQKAASVPTSLEVSKRPVGRPRKKPLNRDAGVAGVSL